MRRSLLILAAVIVVALAGYFLLGQRDGTLPTTAQPAAPTAQPAPKAEATPAGGQPAGGQTAPAEQVASTAPHVVIGREEAPITILEYSSLTCPHCAAFHNETLPQLKQEWLDTGKAKVVYRHFPLDRVALQAAMLVQCVDPRRAEGLLQALFQTQTTWAASGDPVAGMSRVARLAGMGPDEIQACLGKQALADEILQGRLEGEQKYSITSTPTFIVGDQRISGAQPYAEFAKALEAAAKK